MTTWRVEDRRRLVDSRWLWVDRETVTLPDGTRLDDYYVVHEPDFVMALAVTGDDQAVLARQYKHGIGRATLELPAGYLEEDDVSAEAAIGRELREETGYVARRIEPLGALVTSPTRSPGRGHYFLATGCQRVDDQRLDATERIEVVLAPLERLPALVAAGEIDAVSSVAAIFLGLRALGRLTAAPAQP